MTRPVNSQWHSGPVDLIETPLAPVRVEWRCPMTGCGGTMVSNGEAWATYPAGYHHTCMVCGYTTAIKGKKYPFVDFRPLNTDMQYVGSLKTENSPLRGIAGGDYNAELQSAADFEFNKR